MTEKQKKEMEESILLQNFASHPELSEHELEELRGEDAGAYTKLMRLRGEACQCWLRLGHGAAQNPSFQPGRDCVEC